MGYLHEGHVSLMRTARQECDFVVATIFVNPTQFGPNEDFSRYPRDLERDQALCRQVPVDLLFVPSVEVVYPQPFLTEVRVSTLTNTLCGASRPGHFDGVATVVTKLFNMARPDVAYFGQKDAQQVAIIRRLVADLNMDFIEVIAVPTVREPDGLAMSSRNVFLSPEERKAALVLSRALNMVQERILAGERDMALLMTEMRFLVAAEPLATLDYAEIVDYETLQPLTRLEQRALAAIAVKFGRTRLIDNAILQI
jgi:pantoate--beta-alanine ligase